MCITWNLTKKEEIEKRMRHFKTSMTKLIKQSKAKHLNKLFLGNMLILFKIWQGICKIIDINKTKSKETNCVQFKSTTKPGIIPARQQMNLINILAQWQKKSKKN